MLDYEKIIIEKPEALDRMTSLRDKILTVLFWSVLIYFFRPLISLILWILFGIHVFNPDIFNIGLYAEVGDFLKRNFLIILALGATFISWALYNNIRFGRLKRRKELPPVREEEIAKDFGIDVETLKKAKKSGYLKVKIDKDSRLIIKT